MNAKKGKMRKGTFFQTLGPKRGWKMVALFDQLLVDIFLNLFFKKDYDFSSVFLLFQLDVISDNKVQEVPKLSEKYSNESD